MTACTKIDLLETPQWEDRISWCIICVVHHELPQSINAVLKMFQANTKRCSFVRLNSGSAQIFLTILLVCDKLNTTSVKHEERRLLTTQCKACTLLTKYMPLDLSHGHH
jgi:hypothetical protein